MSSNRTQSLGSRVLSLYNDLLMIDPNQEYEQGDGVTLLFTMANTIAHLLALHNTREGMNLLHQINEINDDYGEALRTPIPVDPDSYKNESKKERMISQINIHLKSKIVDSVSNHLSRSMILE
jgi:hypothetical protein